MNDPNFIAATDWQRIGDLLVPLWMIVGAVLGFAGSMLVAHAIIPSLAMTHDLPNASITKVRAPLYAAAVAFFALLVVSVLLFTDRLDAMTSIFYIGQQ